MDLRTYSSHALPINYSYAKSKLSDTAMTLNFGLISFSCVFAS